MTSSLLGATLNVFVGHLFVLIVPARLRQAPVPVLSSSSLFANRSRKLFAIRLGYFAPTACFFRCASWPPQKIFAALFGSSPWLFPTSALFLA
jgi:hypothetical protein